MGKSHKCPDGGIRWRWLHGGYTVQNPVLVATQWLHRHKRKRVCYFIYSGKPLLVLVGTERLELSTYGLRVRKLMLYRIFLHNVSFVSD